MYEDSAYRAQPRRDRNHRAADADREATSERLRRHHAEGRLDVDEFQERIDLCYEAKTLGELEPLVSDLPPEPASEAPFRFRRLHVVRLVPIVVAIVAISLVTGGHHGRFGFWFFIPLFFAFRFWFWRSGPWGMRRRGNAAGHRA